MVMSLITNLTLEASNCSSCLQDGYHLLLPVIQLAALKIHPLTTDNAGQWLIADVLIMSRIYFSLSANLLIHVIFDVTGITFIIMIIFSLVTVLLIS